MLCMCDALGVSFPSLESVLILYLTLRDFGKSGQKWCHNVLG